jgi:hypothetical protein
MSGKLIFYRKNVELNSDIVEMKIWQVPTSAKNPQGIKYSLVYIRDGKRLIGYDNAEGKGHHRHNRSLEKPYEFKGVDALIEDFYADVETVRKRQR